MNLRELFQRQPVLNAPMCGISDYPFREICRRMGAELTYTQMVSAEGLTRSDAKSLVILDLQEGEPLVAMQLFGGEPQALAESVRVLQDRGAALIDLNMGCPVHKVVSTNAGSALLKDLPLVARIFRAMRAAARVPLTVKMRWDWSEGQGAALEAARIAEAEGLEAVCLHARTRAQGYSGQACWDQIAEMKAAVSIPVIGNGDIRQPADAAAMMRHSGCEAVMIGRALIGDPWLFGEALQAARGGETSTPRQAPDWATRCQMMRDHAAMMAERQGTKGLVLFRKHAAAYMRGLSGAKRLRERIMHISTLEELDRALGEEALAG
jgi:nifR3 family TIM-barrel protein